MNRKDARASRLPTILGAIAFALVLILLGPIGFAVVMLGSNPGGSGADPEAKLLIAFVVLAAAVLAGWSVRALTRLALRLINRR
jgi:hypothetical protein